MRTRKSGFTLIEMVIAIALMAVLSLIIVPNVTNYRENAEVKKIKAEMLNVYMAAESISQGYTTKAATETAIAANSYKDMKELTGLASFTGYAFVANADGSLNRITFTTDRGVVYTFNGDADGFMSN